MGRIPCCEKDNVKRGQWSPEEDNKLSSYIAQHGTRNWRLVPKNAGLQRCGKSCRLRWTNYLRPDLNHGEFSEHEEQTIVKLHSVLGNRWSLIAAQLTGRTDNDVKNHWNTKLKKKLSGMGIDPVTHKPFSHLMAEIATTLAPPQVTHLAEAALGCFKDEMLHLLTKRRVEFCSASAAAAATAAEVQPYPTPASSYVHKIKVGQSLPYAEDGLMCDVYPPADDQGFGYEGEGSAWSACTGGGCGAVEQHASGEENLESKSGMFGSECVLWDLSDELMNNIV